jgi:hypothetical protein
MPLPRHISRGIEHRKAVRQLSSVIPLTPASITGIPATEGFPLCCGKPSLLAGFEDRIDKTWRGDGIRSHTLQTTV